jgi:hypothetical protein
MSLYKRLGAGFADRAAEVAVDKEASFRAVRHGRGTPRLQQLARKPSLWLQAAA